MKTSPSRLLATRRRARLTTERKNRIRERAGWKCQVCGKDCRPNWLGKHDLDVDHIIPIEFGGTDANENLWALCKSCHQQKHKPAPIVAGYEIHFLGGVPGGERFDSARRNPAISGAMPRAEQKSSRPGQMEGTDDMARMGGTAQQESEIRDINERDLEWNTASGEPHPAGMYELELAEVKPFEEDGVQRIRMIFHTEEEQENGEPWPVSCKTKPSFHPRANIAKFLIAAGEDLEQLKKLPKGKFKPSSYLGRKVMASIIHEPRQDGQGVYARIESFAPLKKQKTPRPAEPVETEEAPAAPREARKAVLMEDDE